MSVKVIHPGVDRSSYDKPSNGFSCVVKYQSLSGIKLYEISFPDNDIASIQMISDVFCKSVFGFQTYSCDVTDVKQRIFYDKSDCFKKSPENYVYLFEILVYNWDYTFQ
jgi:hypothetical protein